MNEEPLSLGCIRIRHKRTGCLLQTEILRIDVNEPGGEFDDCIVEEDGGGACCTGGPCSGEWRTSIFCNDDLLTRPHEVLKYL